MCGTAGIGGEGAEDGECVVVWGAGEFEAEPLDGVGLCLDEVVSCLEELGDVCEFVGFGDELDEAGEFRCWEC